MSEIEEMVVEPAPVPARAASETPQSKVDREMKAFDELFVDTAPLGPVRPRFAEMGEEPPFKPLPRDYATDLGNGVRPAVPAASTGRDRPPRPRVPLPPDGGVRAWLHLAPAS